MQVKNIDSVDRTWGGMVFTPNMIYTPSNISEEQAFANDSVFLADLALSRAQVIDNGAAVADYATAVGIVRRDIHKVTVTAQPPFAQPDYRTKRDKTASWTTCTSNATTVIDYKITEERYVTGGEIIYKNAKEGDYVVAEVYDTDSVIPSPYRAALCENWPSVAKYLVKWVIPCNIDEYRSFEIDTYPLNAKISAGLYLRVSYVSSSETGDRKVAVNYHLTKRLV